VPINFEGAATEEAAEAAEGGFGIGAAGVAANDVALGAFDHEDRPRAIGGRQGRRVHS
jgi:hypothetical protein